MSVEMLGQHTFHVQIPKGTKFGEELSLEEECVEFEVPRGWSLVLRSGGGNDMRHRVNSRPLSCYKVLSQPRTLSRCNKLLRIDIAINTQHKLTGYWAKRRGRPAPSIRTAPRCAASAGAASAGAETYRAG